MTQGDTEVRGWKPPGQDLGVQGIILVCSPNPPPPIPHMTDTQELEPSCRLKMPLTHGIQCPEPDPGPTCLPQPLPPASGLGEWHERGRGSP